MGKSPKPRSKPKKSAFGARPYNRYNCFFILERESIILAKGGTTKWSAAAATSGEAFRPTSRVAAAYGPLDLPPLPPRFAHMHVPADWCHPSPERKRSHRKSHGVATFRELAQTIAANWKTIDAETLVFCSEVERVLKKRHNELLKEEKLSPIAKELKQLKAKPVKAQQTRGPKKQSKPTQVKSKQLDPKQFVSQQVQSRQPSRLESMAVTDSPPSLGLRIDVPQIESKQVDPNQFVLQQVQPRRAAVSIPPLGPPGPPIAAPQIKSTQVDPKQFMSQQARSRRLAVSPPPLDPTGPPIAAPLGMQDMPSAPHESQSQPWGAPVHPDEALAMIGEPPRASALSNDAPAIIREFFGGDKDFFWETSEDQGSIDKVFNGIDGRNSNAVYPGGDRASHWEPLSGEGFKDLDFAWVGDGGNPCAFASWEDVEVRNISNDEIREMLEMNRALLGRVG